MQAKTSLVKVKADGKTSYVPAYFYIRESAYEQKCKDLERREKAAQKMFPEMYPPKVA